MTENVTGNAQPGACVDVLPRSVFVWFGFHFTVGVAGRLLLSSRVSLLVINLITIQERVREKRLIQTLLIN